MSEVSCRVLVGLFEAMDELGMPVEPMLAGSPYARADLCDLDRRIPWNHYAAMANRLLDQVGPAEVERLGGLLVHQRLFAAHWHVLGLMLHPRHMVWAASLGPGNQMFTVIEGRYTQHSRTHVQLDLRIMDGFDDCPGYFLLSKGVMTRGPELLGFPPAQIEITRGPNRCTYDMVFAPRPSAGLRERLKLLGSAAGALRKAVPMLAGRRQELVDTLVELSRARNALAQSEARLRAVIDSVPDYIITLDADLLVVSLNRADFGVTESDVIGTPILYWFDEPHRERAHELLEAVLSDGQPRTMQSQWAAPDGSARHFSQIVAPIREEGRVVGLVVAARENSAELRAQEERRALERHLARKERMDGLGLLAGGVAHDFNNLLSVIVGGAELAEAAIELGRGEVARESLAQIREAADRATEITRQMLSYAGNVGGERTRVDLSAKVDGISHLIRTRLPARIAIDTELAPGLPPIDADPGALDQIVLNLLGNAVDAIGEAGGAIRVRTGRLTERPPPTDDELCVGEWPPGELVFIEIEDTGSGMTRETMEQIFDPFYSTKPDGHGLGLASVQGVVKSHGAVARLRSTPGVGTRFMVAFPAMEPGPAPAVEAPTAAARCGRVLVVDDDGGVRDVASSVLEAAGYETVPVGSGEEALERYEAGAFDAILLDLSMPGLGGSETCRRIAARDPHARVLLTSGHDRDGVGAQLVREGLASGFLQKPWKSRVLLDAIHGTSTAPRPPRS